MESKVTIEICTNCKGRGKTRVPGKASKPCSVCFGSGVVKRITAFVETVSYETLDGRNISHN